MRWKFLESALLSSALADARCQIHSASRYLLDNDFISQLLQIARREIKWRSEQIKRTLIITICDQIECREPSQGKSELGSGTIVSQLRVNESQSRLTMAIFGVPRKKMGHPRGKRVTGNFPRGWEKATHKYRSLKRGGVPIFI